MNKKKTNLGFITGAMVALIIAITAISATGYNVESDIQQLSQREPVLVGVKSGRVAGMAVEMAKVTVDRAGGNTLGLDFEVEKGVTAFEALQQIAKAYSLELKTKKYDFGVMIEGIGDLVGGQDDKYWLFYINGEMAMSSVDTQAISPGDKVEFRFEASPF